MNCDAIPNEQKRYENKKKTNMIDVKYKYKFVVISFSVWNKNPQILEIIFSGLSYYEVFTFQLTEIYDERKEIFIENESMCQMDHGVKLFRFMDGNYA